MNSVQLFQHASALHSAGRVSEALELYRRIGNALPAVSQFWHFYGLACLQTGDIEGARHLLRRALILSPADVNCLNRYACIFLGLEIGDAALRYLGAAITLNPLHAEANFNLGEAARLTGDTKSGREWLKKAIALRPDEAGWELTLATVLNDLSMPNKALAALARAGKTRPQTAEFFFQTGRAQFDAFSACEALGSYQRALVHAPSGAEGYNNLQIVLRARGNMERSIRAARFAQIIRPQDPVLSNNLAEALFAGGEIERAFHYYHWRHRKTEILIDRRGLPQKWDGSAAATDTGLLLCHEQGIGDEIRFASCVPDIAHRFGGKVLLESDPRLAPLFQRSFRNVQVTEKVQRSSDTPPIADYTALVAREGIDAYLMQGDMARYVRPTLDSFPKTSGFLTPDPEERRRWQDRLRTAGRYPKVGVCWRSGLKRPAWRHNDLEVLELAPLLKAADYLPVCLQYDECEDEIRALEGVSGREIFRPQEIDQRNELDRVAAMVSALDLVISTNTSVLFIAGAVGTPAIGLHAARSAVFLGAESNPWLASERSFVKGGDRSWEEVVADAVPLLLSLLDQDRGL